MTKEIQNTINSWNETCPPGTPVVVLCKNGMEIETVTRTPAWLPMHSNKPVVLTAAGRFFLFRVTR